MSDALDELAASLRAAHAVVTFDAGRNNTHACTFCGKSPSERGESAFELVTIGTYITGGALTRPVCPLCLTTRSHRWKT